jgi:putative transposase
VHHGRVSQYSLGAHTKTDMKIHLVWIPKYRKKFLSGSIALRVRDIIRQIAVEHALIIISGKIVRDHVRVFLSYRPNEAVSQIVQWLKGISSPIILQEFPHIKLPGPCDRKFFWKIEYYDRAMEHGSIIPQYHYGLFLYSDSWCYTDPIGNYLSDQLIV